MFIEKEKAQARYDLCKTCDFFMRPLAQCSKCGCFMKVKVKFAWTKCPVNKWTMEEHSVSKTEPEIDVDLN